MKFIYYNVDRLSLVLPWKTHRYSKGSKSRKGKREGWDEHWSVAQAWRQSDSQQPTVSLMSRGARDRVRLCGRHGSLVFSPDRNPAFTLTEFIVTSWSPFLGIRKPRGGKEARRVSSSAAGCRSQRDTPPQFCHLERFEVGPALLSGHLGTRFEGDLSNLQTSFPKKWLHF